MKSGDWKKLLGTYLVSAKYLLLKYLENKAAIDNDQEGLSRLSREIQKEAESTELKGIPIYTAPSRTLLVVEILEISVALQPLTAKDRVFFSAPARPPVEFNRRLSISQADVDALLTERLPSEPSEAVCSSKSLYLWGIRNGNLYLRVRR